MNKKSKAYKDLLSDLLTFMGEDNEKPEYDIDQLLTEAGFNPDEVGRKFQATANRSIAESPNNWRQSANVAHEQSKEEYFRTRPSPKSSRSRNEIIDAINALLSQQDLKVAFAHRNLSEQTDDDLENLLSQLEYLAARKAAHKDE
jgi:hypothetical protein